VGVLFSLNVGENGDDSDDEGASFAIVLGKVGRFCVDASFTIMLYFSVNAVF
jgi:hypothetical protein